MPCSQNFEDRGHISTNHGGRIEPETMKQLTSIIAVRVL